MKHIKIIILLSLFFGFSSVYAQSTNTETEKNEPEKITIQVDSKGNIVYQSKAAPVKELTPASPNVQLLTPQKQENKKEIAFKKTRPYPNEVVTSTPQQTKSNSKAVTPADKSEIIYTPANPDPNKK